MLNYQFSGDDSPLYFPSGFSAAQRAVVHSIAAKLGLEHNNVTLGSGIGRLSVCVTPSKSTPEPEPPSHNAPLINNDEGFTVPDEPLINNEEGFAAPDDAPVARQRTFSKRELKVDRNLVGLVIGKNGATLKQIQEASSARLEIKQTGDNWTGEQATVVCTGSEEALNMCEALITSKLDQADKKLAQKIALRRSKQQEDKPKGKAAGRGSAREGLPPAAAVAGLASASFSVPSPAAPHRSLRDSIAWRSRSFPKSTGPYKLCAGRSCWSPR